MLVRVFAPFALGYLLSYLLRVINAVAGEPITRELGLSAGELGLLTSFYFAGFALAQIPFGILIDRYGPRRVEALVLLLAAAGCLTFALATGYAHLVVGRTLMGVGASICLMAPFTAYHRWISADRLPLVNGMHLAFGAAGGALGGGPTDDLISQLGWQPVFGLLAGLIVAACAAIWLVVPRRNEPSGTQSFGRLWKDLGGIARSRAFWRIAPMSATVQATSISISSLWTGPWLRQVADLPDADAADWLSVYAIAVLVGFLATGWLGQQAARRGRSESVLVVGTLVFVVLQALIIVLPPGTATLVWIVYMVVGVVGVLTYAVAVARFPVEMAGRVNTTLNFLVFLSAFAVQWLFGVLLDFFPDGAGGYQRLGYNTGFAVLIALQLASLAPLLVRSRKGAADVTDDRRKAAG